MCRRPALGLLTIFLGMLPLIALPQDIPAAVEKELSTPAIKGAFVFKAHCAACHGEYGDGSSPSAARDPKLRREIVTRTTQYYQKLVRGSPHPSKLIRQHALSPDQIVSVVAYLQIIQDPIQRGNIVYKANCILCHGINADGKGRASSLNYPRPADLRHSDKNDQYKTAIIRMGGAPLGRSSAMPPWNGRITDSELRDLLEYLRAIKNTSPDSPR